MALTNRERIGKGIELLSDGLRPYVKRECSAHFGADWEEKVKNPKAKSHSLADPHVLLGIMVDNWNNVFRRSLGPSERSIVGELREACNDWAHNKDFSSDDAVRHLDSMQRLLTAISAAEEAKQVGAMRMDMLRTMFDKARNNEMRKKAYQPTEGAPASGLKAWRDVVTPHPDVASGRYQQAEFAADLWQVYQGEGSSEYRNPTEFFRRTFLTEGLRRLLVQAVRRMNGDGGDPVVELQTNFGGGKTHSMLALYHLFSGVAANELPGVDELMKEEGLELPEGVRRSVFVGTQVSPGKPSNKDDGCLVRTIWGEIAWQLGGKEAFKMVQEDDQNATNPGATLTKLFDKYGPCLILIDEWIAYARQLHTNADLPAGSFDTQFTFAQALTEAAKAAKNTLIVVSIPASESPHQKPDRGATHIEIGGEKGFEALERLKNAIGRVEASWRPASPDEGFEIVRRRLFEPLTNDQAKLRDTVARAFVDYYGQQQQEFPSECREAEYERRIQMAYPIHPELFDRLYNDWSSLEKFQRTRGVLRLMATVIHSLWERGDSNLLILPGAVPIDDPTVQFELTRYMIDQWAPVIDKDVDGPNSLPLALDRETPNLGRFSACRRVARTIYMGSAPIPKAANRGVDEKHVKLGCAQPGETVATFGDAIRRLTDRGTYLYVDGKRYWFSTQPTVNRLADDRANQYSDDDIEEEIKNRLKAEARNRGDKTKGDFFHKVHPCVPSSDIPDEPETALVLLGPEYSHRLKQTDTAALQEAASILDVRGSSPRNYKNSLVFLASDANRLRDLEEAVRQWKAWDSIYAERTSLNLDPFQTTQAKSKLDTADQTVAARIPEAYHWLLVPAHHGGDPKAPIEWAELKIGNGGDSLAKRAIRKLITEEHFFPVLGSNRLRHELDRVPLWRGDRVPLKQLCEDFARYLYLPRLRDEDVLLISIRDGIERLTWEDETFAYAERYDEAADRYIGLKTGSPVRLVIDGDSVLVRSEVAKRQLDADAAKAATTSASASQTLGAAPALPVSGGDTTKGVATSTPLAPAERVLDRFHGSVRLDALRLGRDASRIAEEVVQHLSGIVGAEVEVTLELQVKLPSGASEKLVRDVTENCRTLKFDTYGFEES